MKTGIGALEKIQLMLIAQFLRKEDQMDKLICILLHSTQQQTQLITL